MDSNALEVYILYLKQEKKANRTIKKQYEVHMLFLSNNLPYYLKTPT